MSSAVQPSGRSWFGQPPGLTILFLTEMWEVFSFVGLRTLLVYYMTRELQMHQQQASLIYGLYTGFVYLTPIVGGYIADRWLGRRRAVFLGGAIMALGHFMMASEQLFFPALATVALGNGLFLPSLPSQLPGLYGADDPRRNSAFSVYYMGKNLGALLAPLVCGALGELVGWHWGFAAAGVGMVLGLCVYGWGWRHLPPDPPRVRTPAAPAAKVEAARWSNRWTLLALVAAGVVLFRMVYEQSGNTVALWIASDVNREVTFGTEVPRTWFQSINPLLVFTLTPLLIALWTRRAREGREPSALSKMSLGAALLAAAYLGLSAVAGVHGGGQAHWIWPMLFFAVLTLGELHILPIGLGLFGRMAPVQLTATVLAAWYLTSFVGNLSAGVLGTAWSYLSPAQFFGMAAAVAAVSSLILMALQAPARRLEAAAEPAPLATAEGRA